MGGAVSHGQQGGHLLDLLPPAATLSLLSSCRCCTVKLTRRKLQIFFLLPCHTLFPGAILHRSLLQQGGIFKNLYSWRHRAGAVYELHSVMFDNQHSAHIIAAFKIALKVLALFALVYIYCTSRWSELALCLGLPNVQGLRHCLSETGGHGIAMFFVQWVFNQWLMRSFIKFTLIDKNIQKANSSTI